MALKATEVDESNFVKEQEFTVRIGRIRGLETAGKVILIDNSKDGIPLREVQGALAHALKWITAMVDTGMHNKDFEG